MHSKVIETSLGVEKAHDELVDDEIALEKLSMSKPYDYSGATSKTDPAEIALVRKLDCRIMPMIWAMYFLNYLDKNAIASARLNGLEDDIGLTGSQYNTCISILFVGYLLMQLPSNMLMASKRIRPSIYMGFCMALWAKAGDGEGFNLVLLAFANSSTRLFIIEGVVTFGIAILSMWALPDHPSSTRWLSEQEMAIAQERITRDTVEKTESESALQSLKVAFSDPRLYLLALMQNLHLSSAGFNNFFPTVVGTLGFNRTVTLVLTCPPFVFAAIFGPLLALSSGRFNERTWHITGGMAMGVAGFVIAAATLNTAARYVACFLFSAGVYSVNSCILGWVSATLGQTAEKKAISLGFVNIVANASYIYTPYLYPSSDGPRYLPAMGANAGFGAGTVICAWVLKIWLMAENKKLRASSGDGGLAYAY
ncbi:hypothetical protein AYO20_00394 [Fonsecaea nubica]|uniref:Major facilitator superfamily (MFS) profile domain-containing protein n=1 Tax=Fonsecaea nubica TaxID=856822 RepID=A0A178DF72_9EURO|nr:hypothetical protein AYO20_00394 [Fonsecaea nubica]OAL40658.1 hypothetical protein AYO20_00394 [Fonsecaea nubica]